MENTKISFLHAGSIGDVWASLPALKEYNKKTKNKIVFYLSQDIGAHYYNGATHPTLAPDGKTMVMLNEGMIRMMIPLLKAQPFIEDALVHNGEEIQVDLNQIRKTFVNLPYHNLSKWYFYVYPDLACDLSKKWLEVPETDKDFAKGKIIVARTERYLNQGIDYSFLKKYEKDIVFSGTELEYVIFKTRFGLNIPRLVINDFLELAQAVKQAKFLLSNQTQIFQLSEGQKTPRIVELCSFAPNVEAIGEDAYEFYAQQALEYYTQTLYNKY